MNQSGVQKADFELPLIGRDWEVAALRERLLQNEVRMLTLTGAGGVGKTRLTLTVLDEVRPSFSQTLYVDLTPLKNYEQVIPMIARAYDVKEGSTGLLTRRLADAIGTSGLLLALDNCEHVIKVKPEIDFLLRECPNLKVLATSREAFKLKWEWVFPVSTLQVPDLEARQDIKALGQVASVDLFVRQVQLGDKSFALTEQNAATIADLCVRMDGLPLAIILAASRVGISKPAETLVSLTGILSPEPPASCSDGNRHGTLQRALDWSYALLGPAEKTLLGRLSVFRGSWTLQEAVGICFGNGMRSRDISALLDRLVDVSLVQVNRQAGRGKKFRFLETVREYARNKLRDSGEEDMLLRQHRDWFLVWAEQGELCIWGPEAPEWLEQIETNYDNLWAAMEWCRDTPGEAQCGLRLWAAVVSFYDLKGHVADGIEMAGQLLALAPEHTAARARTLLQASVLARSQGKQAYASLLVQECRSFSEDLGDVFDSIGAICTVGSLAHIEGNLKEAEDILTKACALSRMHFEQEPRVLYISLFWLGVYCCFQGKCEEAVEHLEEALSVARGQGCILFESRILPVMGRALIGKGDFKRAQTILTEGIMAAKELKYFEMIALCFEYLGQAAWLQRKKEMAERLLSAAAALRTYVGVVYWFPDANYSQISAELVSTGRTRCLPPLNMLPEGITAWGMEAVGAGAAPAQTHIVQEDSADILSPRELEITRLITQGLSNRQIAERLFISRRTVDAHVRHILVKLDINTRAQVSAWYARSLSQNR